MAECASGSDQVVDGQDGPKRMCQPCEKKGITMLADIYCETCCEYQCKECCKIHQIYKFMKGHKLEQVNQTYKITSLALPVDMKGVDMCVEHQKQYLSICVDHDKLLCHSCLISNHLKCDKIHELDAEPKETSNAKQTNQDITRILGEINNSATAMLNEAEKVKDSIGRTLEPILNQIDEKKDLVIRKFEDLKVNVSGDITQHKQESEKDLDEVIATTTETLDIITTLQEIQTPILDHGSTSQKFILKQITAKRAKDFRIFRAEHVVTPCAFTFEFSLQLTELLDPKNQLGTLARNTETGTDTHTTLQNNPDDSTNSDKECKEKIDARIPTTNEEIDDDNQTKKPDALPLKLVHSIALTHGQGATARPFYTGIDFLPDGRLVVVDYYNSKLCIYDERLAKIKTFDCLGTPISVAVLSDDTVAVTDSVKEVIQIFKINTQSEITLSRTIETRSQCFSICPINANTLLVGTLHDKQPMRMIKIDSEMEEFENLEQKQYGLFDSRSSYVRSSDMLVLTDRFAHAVYLYNRNGRYLTKQAITHPNIQEPQDVCEGPGNSVLVCSKGTNSLVQVSTSGAILGSHKLDVIYPYAVCMSKDGKRVAVSNSRTGQEKLHIYEI